MSENNIVYSLTFNGKDGGAKSVIKNIASALDEAGREIDQVVQKTGGLDKKFGMSVTKPIMDKSGEQIGTVRASVKDNSAQVDKARVQSLEMVARGLQQIEMLEKEVAQLTGKNQQADDRAAKTRVQGLEEQHREISQLIQLEKEKGQLETKEEKQAAQAARERIEPLEQIKREIEQQLVLEKELEAQQKKDAAAEERAASKIKKAANEQKKALDQVTKAEEQKSKAAEASANKQERTFDRMINGLNRMVNGLRMVAQGFMELGFVLSTFVTAPLTMLLKQGFTDSVSFEAQMQKVVKAVEGLDSTGAAELEKRIRNLAKITPTTVEDLGMIAEQAGQLGLKGNAVYRFLNLVNKAIVGTDVNAQTFATDLGRVAAALGIDMNTEEGMKDMEKLVSVMDLVAKRTSTDVNGIITAVQDAGVIGGMLKNLAPKDLVAGLGVLITSGVDPSAAGTTLQRWYVQIMKNSDKFAAFMKGYVREVRDENGKLVESFEPYKDANDVIQRINDEPIKVLTDTITALGTATDSQKARAIKEFFDATGLVGGRIGAMGANYQKMDEMLKAVDKEWAHSIELQMDYERMLNTTDSAVKIFKNNIKDLGITIGSYVMPYINKAIQLAIPLIQDLGKAFGSLSEKQKMMVVVIPMLAAALGPVLFLVSSLTHSIFLMGSGIVSMVMGAGTWIFRLSAWFKKLGGLKGVLSPLTKVLGTIAKGSAAAGAEGAAASGIFARLAGVLLKFGGSIVGIPLAIMGSLKVLTLFGVNLEKYFVALADRARVWGNNMMVTYGNGMLAGAARAVSKAISTIAGWIAKFFEAHSPPEEGPLSTIDQWGSAVMNTYLKGFLEADFSILSEVGSRIEQAFEIFASLNNLDLGTLNDTFMAFRENIAKVIDTFNKTGQVAEDVLSQIGTNLGTLGTDIQELIRLWLKYKTLQEKLAQLEAKKKGTLKTYDAEIAKISKMNITAEEKAELIRQAQMSRDDELRSIEEEKKSTEEQADAAKEKLDWQKEYIDAQLEFLQMLKKDKDSKKSGSGAEDQLDPIDFDAPAAPGMGGDPTLDNGEETNLWSTKIDEARAELDKYKVKFQEIWSNITAPFKKIGNFFDGIGKGTDNLKLKMDAIAQSPFIAAIQTIFDAAAANVDVFTPLTRAFDSLNTSLENAKKNFEGTGKTLNDMGVTWQSVGMVIGVVIGTIIAVVAGLLSIIVNAVMIIVEFLVTIVGHIIEGVAGLISGFVEMFQGLWDIIVGLCTGNWQRVLEGIVKFLSGAYNLVMSGFMLIQRVIGDVLAGVIALVIKIFTDIIAFLLRLFGQNDVADKIQAWADNAIGRIKKWLDDMWAKFDELKGKIRGWVDTVLGWLDKLTGLNLNMNANLNTNESSSGVSPNHHATGGITLKGKPDLAWVGEGGEQEAIIPLSKLPGLVSQMLGNSQAASTGGIILNINNPVVREEQDIDRIADAVSRKIGKRTSNSSRLG
jgi:TP901 family phage tail tape measure protein